MVKLAETLIKSSEQLFFIPPVMLSLRLTKAIKHYFNFSGAMKHNGRAVSHVLPRLLEFTEKGERGEMGDNACCTALRSRHGKPTTELHRPTVGLHVGFWEFKI